MQNEHREGDGTEGGHRLGAKELGNWSLIRETHACMATSMQTPAGICHLFRFKPAGGIRCQRVPMHLRQELGKEWHEENAAYDGILSAFTNAARNYRSTVMEANVLRTPGFSALRVEIKLGQPEAKRSVSSQEHPKRIP